MRRYGRFIEVAASIHRLAFWVMAASGAISLWLIFSSLKRSPMPHRTKWAIAHNYWPHWHIHWYPHLGTLIAIAAIAAIIVWLTGWSVARTLHFTYDLADAKAASNHIGTPWTGRTVVRHARIYRAYRPPKK